jgi:beta-barrel assembly-enhancing protease
MFSPQQDIEMGQQVAKDAEKQLVLITDRDITAYVAALGQQLVAVAPNEYKFPFTFKVVNERSINAFALPGGPIYIHRGAIESADNEAQIAGVIGHEIAHVILRHGTNQVTKAQYAQGLGALAGILGGNIGKIVGGLGGFAANSVLLRYSRDAETQADLMGTQILYDKTYDPRAMAQFFDKLAKEHKGSRTEQFFSNHPIPENRITKVNEEITKIGPAIPNPRSDSGDFQRVKRALLAMPEPPKAPATPAADASTAPPAPSTRMIDFQVSGLQLRHPDNWKPAVQGTNVTIAPAGGVVGQGDLAYGLLIDVFKPQNANNLDQATQQFLQSLQKGNPNMRFVRSRVQSRVDGQTAQLAEATNDSPVGGQETDVITTVWRNGQLQYFVQVAPTKDLPKYQTAFRTIMDSVRLR